MQVQGSTNVYGNTYEPFEGFQATSSGLAVPPGEGEHTPGADDNFRNSPIEQAVRPADTQSPPSTHIPDYMDSLDASDKYGDEVLEESVLRHLASMRGELYWEPVEDDTPSVDDDLIFEPAFVTAVTEPRGASSGDSYQDGLANLVTTGNQADR